MFISILLFLGIAHQTIGVGNSMEQYGIHNGDRLVILDTENVKEGDFVSFKCRSGCPEVKMIKRLVEKKDGCYWFEGNPNQWEENGEPRKSVDSRMYGWACDVEIFGVVVK